MMNSICDPSVRTVLRHAGEGKKLRVFGAELTFFVTADESRGALSAALAVVPPDNGPPVHTHQHEDELLIVLEGRFSFFADGEWTEAGPGTSVFLPRGQAHAFRNIGDSVGKLYVMANSPHLERFFERSEEPFYQEGGPDMGRIAGYGIEHGIAFVG